MNPPDFSSMGLHTFGTWGSWVVFDEGVRAQTRNVQRPRYRYMLCRAWQRNLPLFCYVMLNPSKADHKQDDPTIRKCIGFTQRHGGGGFIVVNLFAMLATQPAELIYKLRVDPATPLSARGLWNPDMLRAGLRAVDLGPNGPGLTPRVIAAWGMFPSKAVRDASAAAREVVRSANPMCFGTTKDGQPHHPSRIAYATPLVPFT